MLLKTRGALVVLLLTLGTLRVVASTNDHVVLITIDGLASYYFNDPQASLPNLRRLASEGVVAESLKVSSPAVTWPNHTTLVTGVHPATHSVLFNGVLARGGAGEPVRIDPRRDKRELVACKTVYDVLHAAGYTTAGVNWPCTRASGTLDDDFPDVPEQVTHTTPALRDELVAAHVLKDPTDKSFSSLSAAGHDEIWTAAVVRIIKQRKPNFLMFHMLVTDSLQHKYGPQSPAAYTAIALADAQLGQVLEALDSAGIRDTTTVLVTSDHGFASALKVLNPNVLFRKAGFLKLGPTNQIARARAQLISEGGTGMVYLNQPDSRSQDEVAVLKLMEGQEGISQVLGRTDYPGLNLPDPSANQGMPDLILVAKDGYAFGNSAVGDEYLTGVTLTVGNQGYHGYLATNLKMDGTFVASGRRIRRNERIGPVRNIDVAPTIAHLLGQELHSVDGKVIDPILTR